MRQLNAKPNSLVNEPLRLAVERHHTKHNNIQPNDTQHNDIQHNNNNTPIRVND